MLKALLFTTFLSHVVLGYTDCLLGYGKKGRLDLKQIKDPVKMSEMFADMPLNNSLYSMLIGVCALAVMSFGYFGLARWMEGFSRTVSTVMFISSVLYLLVGTSHHVFCGVVIWMYIRMGRTNEAREAVLEFFKKTVITMIICYIGLAGITIPLFIAVVSGMTDLPRWGCIMNSALFFLLLSPTKLPAKGNIAGALMCLGLFILM